MKQNRTARIIVSILFVGMLATPLVIKWEAARRGGGKTKLDAAAALARHGFYLQEVSNAAGVNFVHQGPTLDPQLNHIMPEVASMGASVSIVDFDHDGWMDYAFTHFGASGISLWHNNHGKTFDEVRLPDYDWQRAWGVVAFDYGKFDKAFAHFVAAAVLKPAPPAPPKIKPLAGK